MTGTHDLYVKSYPDLFSLYRAFCGLLPWNVWTFNSARSRRRKEPWCRKAWVPLFKKRLQAQIVKGSQDQRNVPWSFDRVDFVERLGFRITRRPPICRGATVALHVDESRKTLEGHWYYMDQLVSEGDILEVDSFVREDTVCHIVEIDGRLWRASKIFGRIDLWEDLCENEKPGPASSFWASYRQ